jgi:hypothetical protein
MTKRTLKKFESLNLFMNMLVIFIIPALSVSVSSLPTSMISDCTKVLVSTLVSVFVGVLKGISYFIQQKYKLQSAIDLVEESNGTNNK